MEAVACASPLDTTAPTNLAPVERSDSTRLVGRAVLQPIRAAASAHSSGTVRVMSAILPHRSPLKYGVWYTTRGRRAYPMLGVFAALLQRGEAGSLASFCRSFCQLTCWRRARNEPACRRANCATSLGRGSGENSSREASTSAKNACSGRCSATASERRPSVGSGSRRTAITTSRSRRIYWSGSSTSTSQTRCRARAHRAGHRRSPREHDLRRRHPRRGEGTAKGNVRVAVVGGDHSFHHPSLATEQRGATAARSLGSVAQLSADFVLDSLER